MINLEYRQRSWIFKCKKNKNDVRYIRSFILSLLVRVN